jgi:hypothetical protein
MANKATATAGLTFNVNTVRNKLKDYYESQSVATPMFAGGHIAVTAVLEKLYEIVLRECAKRAGKDKSNLRSVNRELMHYSVLLNNSLKKYYLVELDHFDSNQMYNDQVPITKDEMDKIMERVDKDLTLTPKAFNLACYMLLKGFLDIAATASQFLSFSKKKSLDANCVMHTVRNRFPDGMAHELCGEITRAMKASGEDIEDTSVVDNEDNTKNLDTTKATEMADDGEGETKKKSDSKSEKKSKKTDKGKIDEEEDDGNLEEEEPVEAKPKKPTMKEDKKQKNQAKANK